jgi:hypothetical protein
VLEDHAPSNLTTHSGQVGLACSRQPCDVDWNSHHRAGASASHRFHSRSANVGTASSVSDVSASSTSLAQAPSRCTLDAAICIM